MEIRVRPVPVRAEGKTDDSRVNLRTGAVVPGLRALILFRVIRAWLVYKFGEKTTAREEGGPPLGDHLRRSHRMVSHPYGRCRRR